MLHEYKRRQMEFEDRECCWYNLAPVKMSAAYQCYFDRQCAVGLDTLTKADLGRPDATLICGLGGGADLQFLLEHLPLGRCLALDFSIEAIRATQRRFRNHYVSKPVEYLKADIECIPVQDNSVDIVIASQVLHHTLDPAQACQEMFRVARRGVLLLEPADTIMVSLLKRIGLARATEEAGNVVLRFRRSDFESYLDGCDCSVQYRTYLFYDHPILERSLGRYFNFGGAIPVLTTLYSLTDRLVFPLRSKCAVLRQNATTRGSRMRVAFVTNMCRHYRVRSRAHPRVPCSGHSVPVGRPLPAAAHE
jgi:SAM-dependent methyltransferase